MVVLDEQRPVNDFLLQVPDVLPLPLLVLPELFAVRHLSSFALLEGRLDLGEVENGLARVQPLLRLRCLLRKRSLFLFPQLGVYPVPLLRGGRSQRLIPKRAVGGLGLRTCQRFLNKSLLMVFYKFRPFPVLLGGRIRPILERWPRAFRQDTLDARVDLNLVVCLEVHRLRPWRAAARRHLRHRRGRLGEAVGSGRVGRVPCGSHLCLGHGAATPATAPILGGRRAAEQAGRLARQT
mmetsp:Transcript_64440/g.185186  ORF Transcript_64440/g.185186 Transcript_64440/m.185186 type:complete len:237 (-) Transcript_64440:3-713(-)